MNNKKRTSRQKEFNDNLQIISLGGVEEIGVNCTVYKYKSDIIVVDMGLGFSDVAHYGIDYVVPDITFLKERKKSIRGLFITHGHLDHIGALPYLLPLLDFPTIYASEFTIQLIKAKLKDRKINLANAKFEVVTDQSKILLGNFKVEFFRVNHSIPQCLGLEIQTPNTRVVHTGDFKFDNSPINEPVADYAKIAKIGEKGVDILLSDSTNSLKKGHPISESDVADGLSDIIENAHGRVIVATFGGLVGRLYQLLDIAKKNGRKVAIAGYSMNQSLRIATEIGYIKIAQDLIVPIERLNKIKDENILILSTGAQGEENAALSKMANSDYKGIKIKEGDTVVLSAGTIVGNSRAVQNLNDAITRKGGVVFQSDDLDVFTSGHGYQEDQKIMINLTKPKYFMPIHGYQYFLKAHGETAKKVGIDSKNIIIPENGLVIEGSKNTGFKKVKKFKCDPVLVSGSGIGDIVEVVLNEREQLGNYGIVIINVNYDIKNHQIMSDPFILSRGFVYVRKSRDLLDEIKEITKEVIANFNKDNFDVSYLRDNINNEVGKFIFRETEREPIILPVINLL